MFQAPTTGVSVDPIISRLRPRTVAEVLDQAFRLYRKHFLTLIAIIAVVHVPLQLLTQGITAFFVGDVLALAEETSSGSFSSGRANEVLSYLLVFYVVIIGLALLNGLLQKLSEGALTSAVADSHLDKPVTFSTAYRRMLQSVGPLLGLIALQTLITLGVLLPIALVFFLAFGLTANSGTEGFGGGLFCLSCLLIIPAMVALIYIAVRLTVTTPALIVENLGPMQAIRRSWSLIQTYWWRTLGLLAVLWLLDLVIEQGPASLVSAIVSAMAPANTTLQLLISGVVTTITTMIFLPLQLVAITLYYFDLRVRKEGYDLETAMSQRYAPAPPPPGYGGYGGQYGGQYGGYGETQPAGGYGQPQAGQTQPVSGYGPPQLGAETQAQAAEYGSYLPGESATGQPTQPAQYSPSAYEAGIADYQARVAGSSSPGETSAPVVPTEPEPPENPDIPRTSETENREDR